MGWLQAPDYWLARLLFERALAMVYLIAFIVVLDQFRPLLGEKGLLPAPLFLQRARFWQAPSLFHLRYLDRLLLAAAWLGTGLSAAILAGLLDVTPSWASIPIWLVLWVLYLSIVNIGQTFYSFGWESLLLETGLLAAFFGAGRMAPPALLIWLLRWVVFRLEFGAGLIKLRGDPCWRDLTCLYYHHETQPMPNPLSWYFHWLPKRLHRLEVLGNFAAQLVVPFGLFAPQPVAAIAGAIIVLTQSWLLLSGNFAWLNFLTITIALTAFDDRQLGRILPFKPHVLAALPPWWQGLSLFLALVVVVLSFWPVSNLISPGQLMNYPFNRFHFVNTYGAFGSITKTRYEIVIEGIDLRSEPSARQQALSDAAWREYEFRGKPGDPLRRPPQFAPYHLRLDWLMWFAAMAPPDASPWLLAFVLRLLENDPATTRLLRHNPFPAAPPTYVRALYYRYRYSTLRERKDSGAWWVRTLVGEYLPAMRLRPSGEGTPPPRWEDGLDSF